MKRLLSIIILFILFLLTACGNDTTENHVRTDSSISNETAVLVTSSADTSEAAVLETSSADTNEAAVLETSSTDINETAKSVEGHTSDENTPPAEQESSTGDTVEFSYISISQEEAKNIMDNESGYIILDVREQYELDEGHIPGAILIPYTEIDAETAAEKLPDKNQLILVYCRSGRRSKIAAQTLGDLGYTNILEFGGIIDWPYETVNN